MCTHTCTYNHIQQMVSSIKLRCIDRETKESWSMVMRESSYMITSKWALRKTLVWCIWKKNYCYFHGYLWFQKHLDQSWNQLSNSSPEQECHDFKVFRNEFLLRSQVFVNIWRLLCIWAISAHELLTDFSYCKPVHGHWFQSSYACLPWLWIGPNDYRTTPGPRIC